MVKLTLKNCENTRILIAENGKSLREFANYIDISHSYLSQILNERRNPSPTVAYKIAKGLDLNIKDIFFSNNGYIATK